MPVEDTSIVSYLLFADDHEDMRLMVRDVLQSAGHEVALAPDGLSALAAAQAREPDLMILDLAMPGMTGVEVTRAIKRNPFTSHIPVLLLTAQAEVEDRVAGLDAGADDYLAKPFDPRELRARVVALLRLVRREADRNPTSGLPGGRAIEEEIQRRIARGKPFALCYLDFDNFKPFADTFGFAVADQAIRRFGSSIRGVLNEDDPDLDFLGHIGGDDFIVICDPKRVEIVAHACAEQLRRVVGELLSEKALESGTFRGTGRDGRVQDFPIATLSTAILIIRPERWVSVQHLGTLAADVKRRAKQRGPGSAILEHV